MKFLKPKCECGECLVVVEERTYEVIHDITKYGNMTERKIRKKHIGLSDIGLAGPSWLQCLKCQKEYDIDYDDNDRIIKGDIR